MKAEFLFLGTGASLGVPVLGCDCSVCSERLPLNVRTRPSALVTFPNQRFLIDPGPDFRQQALRHQIYSLNGVILTHAHHDHTAGIDDLRPIYYPLNEPLKMLLSKSTAEEVLMRYHYIFKSEKGMESHFIERIKLQYLPDDYGQVDFLGMNLSYVSYRQGGMKVNGFRFGSLAYISDIKDYDEKIFDYLKGIKILVLSALRYTPAPLHISIDEAIIFAEKAGASQVWLTHLSHAIDYEKGNAYLPSWARLAYDGLTIEFTV